MTLAIAIYPREGTKTLYSTLQVRSYTIAIYPREGTKTQIRRPKLPLCRLQFIPARGRKHFDEDSGRFEAIIAIYPREGTKT